MSALSLIAATATLIVVDGDTLRDPVSAVRMRMAGHDSPERGHLADCVAEAAMAPVASARLADLLPGARVEFIGKVDRYNRPLIVLRLPDGRTAGQVLISEGLAVPWAGRQHDWCGAARLGDP